MVTPIHNQLLHSGLIMDKIDFKNATLNHYEIKEILRGYLAGNWTQTVEEEIIIETIG